MSDALSMDDLLAKARALAPQLRAQAPEAEQARAPTGAAAELLKKNQMLTLLLPKRWGGSALSLTDYGRVLMELAKGDMSAGWVVNAVNGNLLAASTRSDATQEALFGAGAKILTGGGQPLGRAQEVAGGWLVDGAWRYCTGVGLTDWVFGSVRVVDKAGQVMPGTGFAYMPRSDVAIKESWFVAGLQGAGADTVVAERVLVPAARMVPPDAGSSALPGAAARAGFLALLVGGATAMVDLVEQRLKTRTKQSSLVLSEFSKAAGQVETARLAVFETLRKLDETGHSGAVLVLEERDRQQLSAAYVGDLVHAAIETIMFIAGSSAMFNSNPLSRYWRDIHMGLRHVDVSQVAATER
jgi:alkylation response protein AidB-like acyl-CoA dehydrogenase